MNIFLCSSFPVPIITIWSGHGPLPMSLQKHKHKGAYYGSILPTLQEKNSVQFIPGLICLIFFNQKTSISHFEVALYKGCCPSLLELLTQTKYLFRQLGAVYRELQSGSLSGVSKSAQGNRGYLYVDVMSTSLNFPISMLMYKPFPFCYGTLLDIVFLIRVLI